jgi:hypothetical protein
MLAKWNLYPPLIRLSKICNSKKKEPAGRRRQGKGIKANSKKIPSLLKIKREGTKRI